MIIDIENIIEKIYKTVETHKIDDGKYARWIWQNEKSSRNLDVNEYGCSDAANILYTIGKFPSNENERRAWIRTLQKMQDCETGLFEEGTHHIMHSTAHCIAALELFDAKPLYPIRGFEKYNTKEGLYDLLNNLDWNANPWTESHLGAGVFAALVLTDSVEYEWKQAYFEWLWENTDSETGFFRRLDIKEEIAPMYYHVGSTFHYLFNHEYEHRPLRYPEKLIDSCIKLYEENMIGHNFGVGISFIEADWVYCLNRASRQTAHRFDDCIKVIERFAKAYIEFLNSIDENTNDDFNDLHLLFGSLCCLAELQQALPGKIITKKPLKLVLDRRPFI